jgi:UDP-3-O-[3-hydroxymyristoyl] glucosamine N-acyltransferase
MKLAFSAAQIAQLVSGTIEGDGAKEINDIGKIESAEAHQLVFFGNLKYEDYLYNCKAGVIIINNDYVLKQPVTATLVRVADSYVAITTLLKTYEQLTAKKFNGIQEPIYKDASVNIPSSCFVGAFSYLGKNVTIGENCVIHPQVFIADNVQLGNNVTLHAGVKVYHNCVLGNNVTIHAGTIIGSDGFGYLTKDDGEFEKVPQIGNVVIEDDVEVGSNTTIDRATMGSTIIRRSAKIDNLVQIAHNVEIGEYNFIVAQAGISGSTKLGKRVVIGGQAGIVGHISLADGTKVNAQSGVAKAVKKENTALTGSPAYDYTSMLRAQAVFRYLPELEKRIKDLEQQIIAMQKESQ